jgi:hypothetical protein
MFIQFQYANIKDIEHWVSSTLTLLHILLALADFKETCGMCTTQINSNKGRNINFLPRLMLSLWFSRIFPDKDKETRRPSCCCSPPSAMTMAGTGCCWLSSGHDKEDRMHRHWSQVCVLLILCLNISLAYVSCIIRLACWSVGICSW